ncbi:MAG: hypothetical protein NZ518_10775 [Dehalococcoidia bacterium]|nr:hypothetical protein [Dehalococcoidia bacterium]
MHITLVSLPATTYTARARAVLADALRLAGNSFACLPTMAYALVRATGMAPPLDPPDAVPVDAMLRRLLTTAERIAAIDDRAVDVPTLAQALDFAWDRTCSVPAAVVRPPHES